MVMMSMNTLNRRALSRSLVFSVATVFTLVSAFTYISTGFLQAFVSMRSKVTNADYVDVQSLTRPIGADSLFTTTTHESRRLLLTGEHFVSSLPRSLRGFCTKSDISISQAEVNLLPNGIPTFSVQITNLCPAGCSVSSIHVACGWFASANLINPLVFRRLRFNDCLVNDGGALDGGGAVAFEYSNSFQYPMRVESAVFCK